MWNEDHWVVSSLSLWIEKRKSEVKRDYEKWRPLGCVPFGKVNEDHWAASPLAQRNKSERGNVKLRKGRPMGCIPYGIKMRWMWRAVMR